MAGPVLAFSYISYRYTAEFVPLLSVGAAVGFATLGVWWCSGGRQTARIVVIAVAAVYSVLANLAAAVGESRVTAGGDALQRRGDVRLSVVLVGGHAGRRDPCRSGSCGPVRPTRSYRRDCDAMYVGTGELFESWGARGDPGHRDRGRAQAKSQADAELDWSAFRGARSARSWPSVTTGGGSAPPFARTGYVFVGDWSSTGRANRSGVEVVDDLDLRTIVVRHGRIGIHGGGVASDRGTSMGTPVTVETEALGAPTPAASDGLRAHLVLRRLSGTVRGEPLGGRPTERDGAGDRRAPRKRSATRSRHAKQLAGRAV